MILRRMLQAGLCACAVTLVSVSVFPVAQALAASPIATYDKDNDKTLDLNEVKDAASTAFDKLDKDHEGTLDRKEVGSRLSKKEFDAADTDHDGTLSKDEYLAVVEKLFKEADVDHEGTLDAKELKSKAGRALLKLLK